MAKKTELKVAVVGYGASFNMGKWHLHEMQKAGMAPVAVCDIDTERLEVAEKDFPGIQTYASISGLLSRSDCDLVTIITPHNIHATLALKCLRAGKHVVLEKPMAITTRECDAMIAEAKRNKVVLSTYHNRHWDGCILRATNAIRKGSIGDIVRIEAHMGRFGQPGDWWRSSKTISGGILYDWGVHLLEYTLQLMQSEIVEVTGFTKSGVWETAWKGDTIEDEGYVMVRYSNGAWSSLLMSALEVAPRNGWLTVTGTAGSYTFDGNTFQQTTVKKDATITENGTNPPSESWRFYQNIADHIAGKEKLVITADWARRPIHIIDTACRSARAGKALKARYA
jgi:scyllo-inositol 2-dehydrogenase (NADP+)